MKTGLVDLLGARSFFGSKVLTPYCYTLGNKPYEGLSWECLLFTNRGLDVYLFVVVDVEIKLDEEGYVLPASHDDEVFKR